MHLDALRPLALAACFFAVFVAVRPAAARAPLEAAGLGASDAFGTGVSTLSDSQRRELFTRVVPILADLGFTRLRLTFGENDTPFAWGDLDAHLDGPRLYTLDELIGALNAAGIEPVLVLSARNDADHPLTTLLPKDTTAWKKFVKLVVERYDGDVDFGVNGCDGPFGPYPNIDADKGSDECTSYDSRSADDSLRLAWARRHVVRTYQLEDAPFAALRANNVPVAEYGQLVALTIPWMRSLVPADLDLRVVLGGVRFATELRGDFVQALAPLAAAGDAARPDAADVFALVDEGATLTGEAYQAVVDGPKSFAEWLSSAGFAGLPFQVGRFTASAGKTTVFPWQAGPGPKGSCHGRFCSERSQIESLVKGLARMSWKNPAPVFVSNVLEYVGQGDVDDDWAYHGLLVERGDSAVTTTDVTPRPAATVLAWLALHAPELAGGELVEVFPVPANSHAFRLPNAEIPTWIAWYDWVKEVPTGGDYLGITKNLDLVDVPTRGLRVTALLPGEDETTLSTGEVFAVDGGTVRIELARDVVLLQGVDEAVTEPAPDVVEAADAVDVAAPEAGEVDDAGGGGCRAGRSSTGAWGATLLAGLVLVATRTRSRRPGDR